MISNLRIIFHLDVGTTNLIFNEIVIKVEEEENDETDPSTGNLNCSFVVVFYFIDCFQLISLIDCYNRNVSYRFILHLFRTYLFSSSAKK